LREDRFIELFSLGTVFYKPQPIILGDDQEFLVDLYVMTYESLIGDAECRNSTFLRILKESMKKAALASNTEQAPPVETAQ